MVEKKLAQRPALVPRAHLGHVDTQAVRLPFEDGSFDYVVCVSVLSLLSSRERVSWLLREFARVLKPGARAILDINGPTSDFAAKGTAIGGDVYEYRGDGAHWTAPVRCYCPKDEAAFGSLLAPLFTVDEIGYAGHRYRGSEIYEFIACVRKPA